MRNPLESLSDKLNRTPQTYSVQDLECQTTLFTGLSYDQATDIIYSQHGRYELRNEKTGVSSIYNYS